MLAKKLKLSSDNTSVENSDIYDTNFSKKDDMTSKHFAKPFWKLFFDIECSLNKELAKIKFEPRITHIYNPIEYASDLHCAYLKKFLSGPKILMFIGMNPGPNGMAQTGVPFGNIQTVRDWMGIEGSVNQPDKIHSKRPVNGFKCQIEEPSGVRFWGLLKDISGDLNVFSKKCYIHNFCPLAFFDTQGRNITPSELKGPGKKEVRDVCVKYLEEKIQLVEPKIIVAVGSYVDDCLKQLRNQPKYKELDIKFHKLAHPSPRSLNNNNWPEKARAFFEQNDIIKYLKNDS